MYLSDRPVQYETASAAERYGTRIRTPWSEARAPFCVPETGPALRSAVIPADLADERDRRRRKNLRVLAVDVRQARILASPAEVIGLERLVEDTQAGDLDPVEARGHVLTLRRIQAHREAQAA